MDFYCLGSGSGGNAYVMKHGSDCILIECGFEYKKLCSKLMDHNIAISDINAVVTTHYHSDHSLSISQWIKRGVRVLSPRQCFTDDEVTKSNVIVAENGNKYDLTPNIRVISFSVNHDCDALGYVFYAADTKESMLFINDSYYFDFEFANYGYDYIFIECNHIRSQLEAIRKQCIVEGKSTFKYDRQVQYHMSLACLKKFLRNMNLSNTKAVFLMHMSSDCCKGIICKTEISQVFNVKTYYCGSVGGFY